MKPGLTVQFKVVGGGRLSQAQLSLGVSIELFYNKTIVLFWTVVVKLDRNNKLALHNASYLITRMKIAHK